MSKVQDGQLAQERREAFRKWLEIQKLNANSAAKKAGISVSVIYNFLNGDTKSISSSVLAKLAAATGSTIDSILNGKPRWDGPSFVPVRYLIGARGSMFLAEEDLFARAPDGVILPEGIVASLVDGTGLLPIPDRWTVFSRTVTSPIDTLVGKLAVVRYAGGGERPCIRAILSSKFDGLYNLRAMNGITTEDVEILEAHEIMSFASTEILQK